MKTIAFLGGIATGKSYICEAIAKMLATDTASKNVKYYIEQPSANPHFTKFLSTPTFQANTKDLQMWFLTQFAAAQKKAKLEQADYFLMDTYPPISGILYIYTQYLYGYISAEGFMDMMEVYAFEKKVSMPDYIVVVTADPIEIMSALYKRNPQEFEAYGKADYMNFINRGNLLFASTMKNSMVFHNTFKNTEIDFRLLLHKIVDGLAK
jgi:deoxyadenosine/deoxycytidine kinase